VSRSQRLLTAFWIAAGVNHFVNPRAYEVIVPDYVPAQREAVFWSGIAEVLGGLAVIPSRTRGLARWWILGVLIAVFPANVHMALHPERYRRIPEPALWARLPVQPLLGWWTWKATAPHRRG
jgi:uncharacterized membrane protein